MKRWLRPAPARDGSSEERARAARSAALGRQDAAAARGALDQRLPVAAAELFASAMRRFAEAGALAGAREGGSTAASDATAALQASPRASGDAGADAAALIRQPEGATGLDRRRRRKALHLLDRVAADLEAASYPLSDGEVSAVALRRRALASAGALSLVALVAWASLAPRNLARGKPVTASSVRFGAPQALVNGSIEWGSFGLHTGASGREWATIDLLAPHTLDSAEIYSRGDGRFEYNLPLRVELSSDGSSFRPAGACTEIFTQAIPCVVDLHHARARYVRVTAPEVVLAEVEVYGR